MTTPVEPDRVALIALARDLIRLPTVNAPGAYAVETAAADLLAGVMTGFGWQVHRDEAAPGRPSVVGVIQGRAGGRTLLFEGHTDVVTAGDPASWSFDPFAGDIVDGRLRGRGSADMKAGLAALVHAARAVQLEGFTGRLVVAALADEEGMMLGAKHFAAVTAAQVAPDGIDGAIVGEPEGGEICACAKGAIRVIATLGGRMAHGAMPERGRSPIPGIAGLLTGLAGLARDWDKRVGEHPLLGRVYLTPTVVQAGDLAQLNVIPARAEVAVDIRTVPGVDHALLRAQLTDLVAAVAGEHGLTGELRVLDDRPPVDTPRDHPVVTALADAHREVAGSDAPFGGVPGTTDGTILTRDAGVASVVYGPGGKWIAHQADEYAEVSDIISCASVFARAARRFFAAAAGSGGAARPDEAGDPVGRGATTAISASAPAEATAGRG